MTDWLKSKVIAVLRHDDSAVALSAARVSLQAGLQTVEVTYTTPDASSIISQLREEFPEATIGAGSITSKEQAEAAAKAGAQFFVSPHFESELGFWFLANHLPYIPGGLTPSELKAIQEQGHKFQKLFPAMVYGPAGVKNLLAPLPDLNLIVTGGVELQNASEYLKSGAKAVCVGGALFSEKRMQAANSAELIDESKKWARL